MAFYLKYFRVILPVLFIIGVYFPFGRWFKDERHARLVRKVAMAVPMLAYALTAVFLV